MLLMLVPGLNGTLADEAAEDAYFGVIEASLKARTIPFITEFNNERKESETTIYYVNGGDIPYVAVSEYVGLLSDELFDLGMTSRIEYTVFQPNPDTFGEHVYIVSRGDNGSNLYIDTKQNTLTFTNFNAFTQDPATSVSVTLMDLPEPKITDFTAAAEELLEAGDEENFAQKTAEIQENIISAEPNGLFALVSKSMNKSGGMVEINLSDYIIDLVECDGECYVPMQTVMDLFLSPFYRLHICDGNRLICFDFGSALYKELYENEPQEMSDEFAIFNYNELRMILDSYYGLKKEHNIDDFGSYLDGTDLIESLVSTNPRSFDRAISKLVGFYFDDMHSGFLASSWRSGQQNEQLAMLRSTEDMGVSSRAMLSTSTSFKAARSEAYPDGVPMYEEVGDTAFITFDSFVRKLAETADYYDPANTIDPDKLMIDAATAMFDEDGNLIMPEEPEEVDTIQLLIYAHQMISRENSPIKNVVVDLSCNGGGQSDAALFVVNWMLGRADIALHDTFTGAESIMSFRADTNLDNEYMYSNDSLKDLRVNVYCMISPNSFSCGNLVPAACKMSHRVTLIGQTSGGGSCVVLPMTSASGTIFQISGAKQLSTVKNGSFYNIDEGVEPDIYLSKAASFYDREALVEYLHEVK